MKVCEDCGTRLSKDACPNCDEEYVIVRDQGRDLTWPLSEEFSAAVDEQTARVSRRREDSRDTNRKDDAK